MSAFITQSAELHEAMRAVLWLGLAALALLAVLFLKDGFKRGSSR